jgi:hypothetical protein
VEEKMIADKLMRYTIISGLLLVLLAVSHLYAYRTGKNVVRGEMAEAVADYQLAEHELLTKLAEARREKAISDAKRSHVILKSKGDCMDVAYPDDAQRELRAALRGD